MNARSVKPHERPQEQPHICAATSPPAFKTIRDHDEHKSGGKNQFRNALPMVMIWLLITFRYFTTGTQNGLGKKKIVVKKKKKTKGRICAMLTVTTKHLPELQCSVTIILCRTVMFSARGLVGGAGSSEKEMRKRTKPNKFCSSGTFQVIIKQVCYTTFSKKMCSKANMITFLFKKLNHQGVLCKKIMCKIYPCMDFKN